MLSSTTSAALPFVPTGLYVGTGGDLVLRGEANPFRSIGRAVTAANTVGQPAKVVVMAGSIPALPTRPMPGPPLRSTLPSSHKAAAW
ncbi:hypothetical protein A3711_02795 [Erythrobacter sp. HI00D59]|nr:hypothetical protein A3711_02795 [Erythrobacter sp. HI00D59]